MSRSITAADLFCGAGGSSTGLAQACAAAGISVDLLAINHWSVAIDTHSKNHPEARHLCESLDSVDPRKVIPGGRLSLLIASPECTHHSNARGGKPMSDQSRSSAWHILRWAEALYIENILIENVREFMNWGPLGADDRPLKSKRGETFRAFLEGLRSLNYDVDYRVLNAADYGDPTTRERLFVMARKRPRKVRWPEPTHRPAGEEPNLFGAKQPWRTAREVIDWGLPGTSIFGRKRPLSPTTIARIAAGLRKFGGPAAEPFLVMLYGTGKARSVDDPCPTVTAGGGHIGLCEPFIAELRGGKTASSIDDPISTVTTKGAHHALVEPFVVQMNHSKDVPRSVDSPMATVTATSADFALVEPFLIGAGGPTGSGKPRSVDDPMGTVMTENHTALIEPFLLTVAHGDEGPGSRSRRSHSIDNPLPTVTTEPQLGVVEPYIIPLNHGAGDQRSYSMERPMPTVTTIDAWAMIEPYLVKYYGTGGEQTTNEPLGTITAKDRFGLVRTMGLDIRFRMLQPHELARAMSFPDDYQFTGNRELKVKQIGNAVPVSLAKSLCSVLIGDYRS